MLAALTSDVGSALPKAAGDCAATRQLQTTAVDVRCARGRRDAEVLSLFATIINKLQAAMEKEVPRIFEAVFEVTLDMITKNFEVHCSRGDAQPMDSLGTDRGPSAVSWQGLKLSLAV